MGTNEKNVLQITWMGTNKKKKDKKSVLNSKHNVLDENISKALDDCDQEELNASLNAFVNLAKDKEKIKNKASELEEILQSSKRQHNEEKKDENESSEKKRKLEQKIDFTKKSDDQKKLYIAQRTKSLQDHQFKLICLKEFENLQENFNLSLLDDILNYDDHNQGELPFDYLQKKIKEEEILVTNLQVKLKVLNYSMAKLDK